MTAILHQGKEGGGLTHTICKLPAQARAQHADVYGLESRNVAPGEGARLVNCGQVTLPCHQSRGLCVTVEGGEGRQTNNRVRL